jgi:hypothetical protein
LGGSQFEVSKTPSQSVNQVWWFVSVVPATWEVISRRSVVKAHSGKNKKSHLKNNLEERLTGAIN